MQPQAQQAAATGADREMPTLVLLNRNLAGDLVNREDERTDSLGRLLNPPGAPVAGARSAIVLLTYNEHNQLINPQGERCDIHGRLMRARGSRGGRSSPQPHRIYFNDPRVQQCLNQWSAEPNTGAGSSADAAATGASADTGAWANYRPPQGVEWGSAERTQLELQAENQANMVRRMLRSRADWNDAEWELYRRQQPSSEWEADVWARVGWQDWSDVGNW